ncbi:hypothetical protein BTJ40_12860 [Microbulbifer sp. A4B17]|uniref:hypothetical protein n=1 Tax=Microbulbifer sp. A4B17 TaxID=359370 RepID=UPI000D52EAB4|nr:hypothetical protein [Microbulbifer sp. A4B17]AWF81644.1 hypothetical protein BTJ40_12860 [Microbulbifer sp. A4B17]
MISKLIKFTVIFFLGLFLIALYFVIQFNSATRAPCSNLQSLSKDEVLLEQLWSGVENVLSNFSNYRVEHSRVGLMYAEDAYNNFDIDWGLFDIPVNVASLEFYGRNIDYGHFEVSQVESIKVGYGYRYYLEFKLAPLSVGADQEKVNDKLRYTEVLIECRE